MVSRSVASDPRQLLKARLRRVRAYCDSPSVPSGRTVSVVGPRGWRRLGGFARQDQGLKPVAKRWPNAFMQLNRLNPR
jgi:hypothetical protein